MRTSKEIAEDHMFHLAQEEYVKSLPLRHLKICRETLISLRNSGELSANKISLIDAIMTVTNPDIDYNV